MATPPGSAMHINRSIANFTLANMADDASFIGSKFNFLEVDRMSDYYYIYDPADWNRLEMQYRGSSEESGGSGWNLSNTTYLCQRRAVHKDFDWSDAADADEAIDLEEDSSAWAAHQVKMDVDYLINAAVMQPSTWTTDYDGVSGTPSTNEIKQWSSSGSDPLDDHMTLTGVVKGLCGFEPNTMIVGQDVHFALITNSVVRSAIQYTEMTGRRQVEEKLASYFGVDNYIIGGAFYNTAKEGLSASYSYLINPKDLWCGYLASEVKKRTYTAFKVFAWKNGGMASQGITTRKFDIEELTSTRVEVEDFLDVKVTAAAAAYYVDDCVA